MIPRDIDKAIQFLLEQQAVTEARQQENQVQIRELAEQNKKLSGTVDKLTGTVDVLSGTVDKLIGTVEKLADGFRALRDAGSSLVEHARLTDARLTRLEQSET